MTLNNFIADIDFNVSDTVLAFGNVLTTTSLTTTMSLGSLGQGHGHVFETNLDDANVVTVTSGTADVQLAEDIQGISGYNDSASDYDITDTAANLISAGDSVLDKAGVDVVTVTDGACWGIRWSDFSWFHSGC